MKWRSLEESAPAADTCTLREILAERKESITKYVPEETRRIRAHEVAELKRNNLAANIVPAGAEIPQFQLPDQNGKAVASSEILAEKRLVICFIRGRWCPFCVAQMEAMNAVLSQIEEAGARLIAISPQSIKQSFFMHDQHKLRFALLSDAGNVVARMFRLTYAVSDGSKALYKRTFVNLPFINGDDSWELPIPATYIIGRDGKVQFASASEDYSERPEPSEILHHLRVSE